MQRSAVSRTVCSRTVEPRLIPVHACVELRMRTTRSQAGKDAFLEACICAVSVLHMLTALKCHSARMPLYDMQGARHDMMT